MTSRELIRAALEFCQVELAVDPHTHHQVVDGRERIEQLEKELPLLDERERDGTRLAAPPLGSLRRSAVATRPLLEQRLLCRRDIGGAARRPICLFDVRCYSARSRNASLSLNSSMLVIRADSTTWARRSIVNA